MADKKPTANELRLVVLSPSKRLVDTTAEEIYFPSAYGVLGILPGHALLVCQLGTGILHYDKNKSTAFMTISGGVAEVRDNTVTLLVDVAEDASNIDVGRAEKALQRARELLGGGSVATVDMDRAAAAESRAVARIEAATRTNTRK